MKINSVYKDAAKFSGLVFLMGIVEFILFTIFLAPRIDVLIGVVFGCAFVSLNFFYLAYSVKKSVERDEKSAKAYMASSATFRMLFIGSMLIIAAKVEWIYLWAAIIPLVFQRLAVYILSFINIKGSEKS